ncbi:MAG: hypothetical protein U9N85_11025 [Bacteroidota bacterium]|nr:hypothetical protein [Bacteroidota bacterium]
MRKLIFFLIIFTIPFFVSCEKEVEGVVKVQNKVHNVRLEQIRWNDRQISYSLLPGETSDQVIFTDYKEFFPKTEVLEFYMTANNKRVYLKTRESYTLNAGGELNIIISDDTEVLNPITE